MKKIYFIFFTMFFCLTFNAVYASVVVQNGVFSGAGNKLGVDGFGHEWSYDTNDDGTRLIWSMPELGMSESFAGPGGEVNGFFIEFYDNTLTIDMTPREGPEDYEFRTEFISDGLVWEASFTKFSDRIRVDFSAPENIFMNVGDYFSTAIVFGSLYNPSIFTFTAGWLHIDNGGGSTIMEPSFWMLMVLACTLFFMKFRRNKP